MCFQFCFQISNLRFKLTRSFRHPCTRYALHLELAILTRKMLSKLFCSNVFQIVLFKCLKLFCLHVSKEIFDEIDEKFLSKFHRIFFFYHNRCALHLELAILTRKMLSNADPRYKRLGVLAAVLTLKNCHDSQDSSSLSMSRWVIYGL